MQTNLTPKPGVVPSIEELDKFLNLPEGKDFESVEFGVLSNNFDGSKFTYKKSKVISRGNLHENAIKNIKLILVKQIRSLVAECFSKLKKSNKTKNNYNETLYIGVEIPGQLPKLIVCKHPILADAKLVSSEKEIVSSDSVKFITEEMSNLRSAMFEMYFSNLERLTKNLFENSPEIDFIEFSSHNNIIYFYSLEYEFPNGAVFLKKEMYKIANRSSVYCFVPFYHTFWFRNGKTAYSKTADNKTVDVISELSQNYKMYIDTKCFLSRKELIETIISAEKAYFQSEDEEPT